MSGKRKAVPIILILVLIFPLGVNNFLKGGDTILRSESATLSKEEALKALRQKSLNCPAEKITGKLKHQYEQQTIGEVKVVIDKANGLMWQQMEGKERPTWLGAEEYIKKMNEMNLAGFSDWRLPTLEELGSLLEAKKKNENYLDPIFERMDLLNTWTVDIVKDAFAGAWFVSFSEGNISVGNRAFGMGNIRLVRTIKE